MNELPSRLFKAAVVLTVLGQALTLAGTCLAQSSDLKVNLQAKRVVLEQGKEILAPAEKAKPGDTIQYEAAYQNIGKAPLRNVAAIVPIPGGLSLVADSAKPSTIEASLDGKTFNPTPLTRPIKNEAGVVENKPVPLSEYRAVRWTLAEVAAGTTTTVSLRARVTTNGSPQ